MKNSVQLVLLVVVAFGGCNGEEEKRKEREAIKAEMRQELAAGDAAKAKQAADEKAAADAAKAAADAAAKKAADDARNDVVNHPDKFLKVLDLQSADKGLLNHYRQPISVSVSNTSAFTLGALAGNVEYTAPNGAPLGSVPIQLVGVVDAGTVGSFSARAGTLRSGTLQGLGTSWKVHWTQAKIVTMGHD